MTSKLLALDGTNLLYRSYHALSASGLSHAGRPVWAVHGLLLQIAKAVEFADPTHLLVAFDTPGGCPERLAIDPGYKATRSAPAADLTVQLTWAPSVLRQIGLSVVEHDLWEADDLLASAVAHAEKDSMNAVVVTSDRDAYQLVSENVTVRTPDERTVDLAYLETEVGVTPQGYALLAALRGEPSDNLPGIAGVGQKTALKLVQRFGSLDAIDAASDEELRSVLGPKAIAAVRRDLYLARRTFQVATLRRDLLVDLAAADLAAVDHARVERVLQEVGLPAAGRRLLGSLRGVAGVHPAR